MKQALDALEDAQRHNYALKHKETDALIFAIRAAIEQAQEPVAWMYVNTDGECEQIEYIENDPMPDDPSVTPLYTAPRQWQGLTADEIWQCNAAPHESTVEYHICMAHQNVLYFAEAIEAKLKAKNA